MSKLKWETISSFFEAYWDKHCKGITIPWWVWFFMGGIGAVIFPPFKSAVFGYMVIVLFLSYLFYKDRNKKELFSISYLWGIGFYIVSFSWINNALLIDDAKLISFIPLVVIAIGLFFGLFWAIPVVLSVIGKKVYSKMLYFCVFFVVMEWVRSFIFTGFPWNLLGTALSFDVRLIQSASVIGTYGLSLLLILILCGVALLLISVYNRRFYNASLIFILLPLLFIFFFFSRFEAIDEFGKIDVRIVQPNIPQTLKWSKTKAYENFRKYIDMSKDGLISDIDFVVWGETASPYPLDMDFNHLAEVVEAIPENGFLVTGVLRGAMENGEIVPYNSMFVINSKGMILDYYDKAHLVPFGEYLPFRKYLPDFMKPVANVVGNLGSGEKYKNIRVEGLPVMGGAICYESIFPKEVVNPNDKPELLFVLVNDGWYGISAGPIQHLIASQMRAVEEGITVIRSANTGISAVIADNGQILGLLGLDKEGVIDIKLPKQLSRNTLYGKFGNLFLFLLLAMLVCVSAFIDRKNK